VTTIDTTTQTIVVHSDDVLLVRLHAPAPTTTTA
jgi:hypothetical protein